MLNDDDRIEEIIKLGKEIEKKRKEQKKKEKKEEHNSITEEKPDSLIKNSFNQQIPNLNHYVFDSLWKYINDYPDKVYLKKALKNWINEYRKKALKPHERRSIYNWENHIQYFLESLEYVIDDELDLENEEHMEICKDQIDRVLDSNNEDKKIKFAVLTNWFNNPKNTEREYKITKSKLDFFYLWERKVIDNIDTSNSIDYGNNQNETQINLIIDEMERCINFASNTHSFNEFKSICSYAKKDETISEITKDLEKQMYLSYDNKSEKCYITDGKGRFQDFDQSNKNNIYKKIKNGCYQIPNGRYEITDAKPIEWISRETVFEKIPKFIEQSITPDTNLIGFENGFINVKKVKDMKDIELSPLDAKYPRLPLKQVNTNYLTKEIPNNAIQKVFEECFTENDRKIILAYLGLSIFEQGYINHQEILYIMGLNNIGKTSLIKIITSIFNNVQSVDANKISNNKPFGLSQFAYADVVIIDELTNASKDFNEKVKSIASGLDVPIEEKYKQNSALPAEYVPRIWISGNRYEKDLYESAVGGGVTRRILPIIPIKSFIELDNTQEDWEAKECKEWLVQQATQEYIDLIQDGGNIIGELITLEDIEERLEKLTYPERALLREHFELAFDDYGAIDEDNYVLSTELFNFINKKVKEEMLEPSIKSNMIGWVNEVETAFEVYGLDKRIDGKKAFEGIKAKTDEAEAIVKHKSDNK